MKNVPKLGISGFLQENINNPAFVDVTLAISLEQKHSIIVIVFTVTQAQGKGRGRNEWLFVSMSWAGAFDIAHLCTMLLSYEMRAL